MHPTILSSHPLSSCHPPRRCGLPAVACLMLLFSGFAVPLAATEIPNLTYARHEILESKVLGERRDLLINAPEHPVPGAPLLVVLDGEWNMQKASATVSHLSGNGRLPPMVVVGVVNTDRGRDMMPIFAGASFAPGPADRFLSFLADELVPYMTSKYSIGPCRVLVGHSNAGAFALYAFARRPGVFPATISISPAFGLDERFQSLVAKAANEPAPARRFVFVGAGGAEEVDTSVGPFRFAKTFESAAAADLEWHYESFPGQTHGSVPLPGIWRGLELLGQPDPALPEGPGRYLSEAQRQRHAWVRRFGSAFSDEPLPLLPVTRPIRDALATKADAALAVYWKRLQSEHAADFRFDPVEQRNVVESFEAAGDVVTARRLRALPDFWVDGPAGNNYGTGVDLQQGLVAHLPLDGRAVELCHPQSAAVVHGAVPCTDRFGREGRAFRFDGKDTFIELPWSPDYSTAGSVSVSAWICPRRPAAYNAWMSQCLKEWGSQWRLGFGPSPEQQWGATSLASRWTDYWVGGAPLPVGRWVHTAAVFDQTLGVLRIYLDGREVFATNSLRPWIPGKGPLLIGEQRDDGLHYDGDVGEVRVYRRTLNAAEVARLAAE